MSDELIQRWQPGGDLYQKTLSQHGAQTANACAAAALNGDRTEITAALAQGEFGDDLNDSTWSIFADQIVNEPFKAPADMGAAWVNRQLKDISLSLVKNPLTLALVVAVGFGVFLYFGGARLIRRPV
jgi:hypothetical protein